MNESLQGMQRSNAQLARAAANIARPPSAGPELQARDTLRDVVDLSQASQSAKANAVVFSVAAEMSTAALELGSNFDRSA